MFIVAITVAFIGLLGGASYYIYQNIPPTDIKGTFAEVSQKCGGPPVIVSDKIYYEPGSQNNPLFSMYKPSDLNLSDYPNHKFYCTVEQAKKAGYYQHACCGYYRED